MDTRTHYRNTIQENLKSTDLVIVDDLLAAGIPKSDIILGFHHPSKRAFTLICDRVETY